MNNNFYLSQGNQTKITPIIKKIADGFKSKEFDLIFEVLTWTHRNVKLNQDNKLNYFRKRTVEEIINSKFVTGCTDYALIFITLMRSKNVPVKYIETIKKDWLKQENSQIQGHVFTEVFIKNKWYIVDPQEATIKGWYGKRFIKYAEGLDSWNIGIKNFNDLKKQFLDFKKKYNHNDK